MNLSAALRRHVFQNILSALKYASNKYLVIDIISYTHTIYTCTYAIVV